jgi:hypothetical protein
MDIRATIAAIILSAFGFFLIWKGISGDVIRLSSGKAFIPRWIYILGGCIVLILPTAYLVVQTIALLAAE